MDLRKRIIEGRKEGESAQRLAQRYKVSKRTVERYWRRYEETGRAEALPRGGYRRALLEGHDAVLRGWIQREPSLTLGELMERCSCQLQVRIQKSALANRLSRLGLSYKKNAARQRARAARS